MADVFRSERPVDLPAEDPAHAAHTADARHGVLARQPLLDQRPNEAEGPHVPGTQIKPKLRPGEDTAVQTHQGDPFGFAPCPAERLQCFLPVLQMGNHDPASVTRAWSACR